MNEDIWNAILARTATWSEILELLTYFKTTKSAQFTTLQMLCFADLENYAHIHSSAEEPVDPIYYSYLKYFLWELVDINHLL